MYIKNFLISIILVTCYLLLVTEASAAPSSIEVYPPIIQIKAIAPVILQTPIIIKNPGEQTEVFTISLKPFTQSDEQNGQVRYLKDKEFDFADPLMLQRIKVLEDGIEISQVELAPKQQKQLKITIDIPEGEIASDYYFSLLFTSTPPTTDELKNKSNILTAVATNILLTIGKEEKAQVKIEKFYTSFFKDSGPIDFKIKVVNTGGQFISAKGYILITNIFGQIVGKVDLATVNILANTSRITEAVWKENLFMGFYTATLNLQFKENETEIKTVTHFIGAPVQILTVALIVISLLLLTRSKLKHRLRR